MTVFNAVWQQDRHLVFKQCDVVLNQGEAYSSGVCIAMSEEFKDFCVKLLFRRSDGKTLYTKPLKVFKRGNRCFVWYMFGGWLLQHSGSLFVQIVATRNRKVVKSVYSYNASLYVNPSIDRKSA